MCVASLVPGYLSSSRALKAGLTSDPGNGTLEYEWSGPFGTATVTLAPGTWRIDLTARDVEGTVATDTVVVAVRDTVAPTIMVRAAPDLLWPPGGSLRPVSLIVNARDLCDPRPDVVLASIVSSDPTADPSSDIAGAAYGTDDRAVLLRARRARGNEARIYTATYSAMDHSGNQAAGAATVLVPKHP
jgi:hypothetical protein